jgi:hypothetical protein
MTDEERADYRRRLERCQMRLEALTELQPGLAAVEASLEASLQRMKMVRLSPDNYLEAWRQMAEMSAETHRLTAEVRAQVQQAFEETTEEFRLIEAKFREG